MSCQPVITVKPETLDLTIHGQEDRQKLLDQAAVSKTGVIT